VTRLPGESARRSLVLTTACWIGAAISVVLLVVCVLGLVEYAHELGRRDPTAGVMLGVVIWAFGLAVVFGSWLILRSVPLNVRRQTGFVLAGLIAASWVVGLGLNSNG